MKHTARLVLCAVLLFGTLAAHADEPARSSVYEEIAATLGFVPGFFYEIPERILPEQWTLFQDSFLRADGPLTAKQKELIAIAAGGIRGCQYCPGLHIALARYHGATREELEEAAQVGRTVGAWSTFLYSINYPVDRFERDVERIISNLP